MNSRKINIKHTRTRKHEPTIIREIINKEPIEGVNNLSQQYGISKSTIYNWIKCNQTGGCPWVERNDIEMRSGKMAPKQTFQKGGTTVSNLKGGTTLSNLKSILTNSANIDNIQNLAKQIRETSFESR